MRSAPLRHFERRHRARFDALRREIFGDMGRAAARWRLAWIVPYNLFVIAVLMVVGVSPTRVGVQAFSLLVGAGTFILRARSGEPATLQGLCIGTLCYEVSVANTGGMGSPLLASGLPILVAIAVHPIQRRQRAGFYGIFFGGITIIALLSHTAVGQIPAPLAMTVNGFVNPVFAVLATTTLFLTGFGIQYMGKSLTETYERVALELAERREEACTENEDRTRALEGIAARLAHEVKNPLAAIKGLSTHMARNATDPKTAERLAIVAGEADRLQAIVDGFLSFSRGLDDLVVGPVVPYALARELTVLLETRAAESNVNLEVKGSAELVVNADGRKLRQALLNLVLNAMQASPDGGTVTMEIAKCCAGSACVRVIDHGVGMTPEVLERIRKPYFTTREGGSGLGIAVARGLIEQHGGNLRIESKPQRGTTVSIDLPACAYAAAAARKLPNPSQASPVVS